MLRALLSSLVLISTFFLVPAKAEQMTISGSTSVSRIMDILVEEYNRSNPNQFIAVQGIGSTAGITMVSKGVSELGMSSRYLTEAESTQDLKVVPIAYDGLAVVVNHSNEVANLSSDQLYDIYRGNITNWKEVGGADKSIAVVTREASSGSRYSFESVIGLSKIINNKRVSNIYPNALVVNSNSMVKTIVNHNPQAIGFISMGSIDSSIKAVSVDEVAPTSSNITKRDYGLVRPFLVFHLKSNESEELTQFTKFLLTPKSQESIEQYGYSPIIKFK